MPSRTTSPGQSPGDRQTEATCVRSSFARQDVAVQRLMPLRATEAMARASGKGHVFTTDVEVDKRTAYARRTGTS